VTAILKIIRQFGPAPVTIRKAVRQLRDEGLVRTTPGWGTYVVKKTDGTST
jgi:DNA-binding GntR family transcriptional regulator